MPHVLFGPEIKDMLDTRDEAGLRAFCDSMHPATVAEAIDEFSPEQIWDVIGQSDIRTQASIFEYLPTGRQVEMLERARPQVVPDGSQILNVEGDRMSFLDENNHRAGGALSNG